MQWIEHDQLHMQHNHKYDGKGKYYYIMLSALDFIKLFSSLFVLQTQSNKLTT